MTKQFVEFKRVVELNEWLRLYGDRIIIKDWQAVQRDEIGVTYVLLFHLDPMVAHTYIDDDGNPIPNNEQLEFLIKEAYRLQ